MPWRLCDLPKYPAALTTNRNRFCPFPPLRSGISGHRSSSHFRALLSAAPSPETLIPPLSLPLPRLPSHVHSNTCCERPLPSLPVPSPGTSTSAAASATSAAAATTTTAAEVSVGVGVCVRVLLARARGRRRRRRYGALPTGYGEVACPTRPNRLRPRRLSIGQYCLLWGWGLKMRIIHTSPKASPKPQRAQPQPQATAL